MKQDQTATVIIGGDVYPSGRAIPLFIGGDGRSIFHDLADEFGASDLRIINLECPLTDNSGAIQKVGPNLRAGTDCIRTLKNAHINVVNLANNHIMDQGPEGLYSTIKACEKENIVHIGAGRNIEEASLMRVFDINGISIGLMSYAEHQFSTAGDDSPGANPLDLMEFVRTIRTSRNEIDFLIVLLHAGKAQYHYPPPFLQQYARFMAEEGVDIIVCQHSHCPIGYEYYLDSQIHYGQGNLIFDMFHDYDELWHQGYLLKVTFSKRSSFNTEIIPYNQSDHHIGAKKMDDNQKDSFLGYLLNESNKIKNPSFVKQQWIDYCERNKYTYFSHLLGHGRFARFLNRILHFSNLIYSKKQLLILKNLFYNETLQEILKTTVTVPEKKECTENPYLN